MKKVLPYTNLIVGAAGLLGMLLMNGLFAAGTDKRDLYPANHPAWILLGILSVALVVAVWLLSRNAGTNRSYRNNFPASIPAALGLVAALIGLFLGSLQALSQGKLLGLIAAACGILGSLPLCWAAFCRFRGQRCPLPVHILPCFYFTLQLFVLGQQFGSEPEICRYLYRFWATVSMVPACYWLWSFDVNLGKRPVCLFWCLVAGYSNLVAAAGSGQWLMHICIALWMLTAVPKLQYLPKSSRPAQADTVAEEQPPEVAAEPAAEPDTEPAADPLTPQLPDADAILEALLRDYGSAENSET